MAKYSPTPVNHNVRARKQSLNFTAEQRGRTTGADMVEEALGAWNAFVIRHGSFAHEYSTL
jgi:hypothetical protein